MIRVVNAMLLCSYFSAAYFRKTDLGTVGKALPGDFVHRIKKNRLEVLF